MSKKTAHVSIDIHEVVKHGTVENAIEAWAKESDTTASGTIGPEFSTSGPGSGWSKTHGAADFAERAVSDGYGALAYIDSSDGRLATRPGWTEEGTSGEHEIVWSDDSVVEVECPNIEDAIEHPETVREMAQAVIDYHGAESDREAWAKLVKEIQEAAEELRNIDPEDFEK